MPIRPENRDRYPADWDAISRAAKDRANWQCACTGQCGRGTHPGRCPNRHGEPAYGTGTLVILTTAHLNHTPEDCRPDNLVPMCQGCHLHMDRAHHLVTATLTRAATAAAAGQLALEAVALLAVPVEPRLPPAEPAAPAASYDVPLPLELPAPPERNPMRITATIHPIHADRTVCTHKVTSTGKPKEPGCSGRTGYTASCSAGDWTKTSRTKAELEYTRDSHLRSHLTNPATPARA
jgi:hypothetical protein